MKATIPTRNAECGMRNGIWLLLVMLAGCAVGPNYQRPTVNEPGGYRRAASDTNAPAGTNTLADLGWWEAFDDPQLTAYVGEALTNSWDIKIAVARVLQAEAAARVTRSRFFPTILAGGDLLTTRASEKAPTDLPSGIDTQHEYGQVAASMLAYEVDIWGRIRRAERKLNTLFRVIVNSQPRKVPCWRS